VNPELGFTAFGLIDCDRRIVTQRNISAAAPNRRTYHSNNKCSGLAEKTSYLNHYKKVYILKIVNPPFNVN